MTVQCLVPISGGKDSQLCLELALAHFPKNVIRGLFCDTKFEHPWTYEHIAWMRDFYGIEVDTVSGGDVLGKSLKYGRFPGGGARHCTDELKIRETKIYCKQLAERQRSGFEVWYGMRSNESRERAERYGGKLNDELYAPHEVMRKYPKYLAKLGVKFRLPILDWPTADVFAALELRWNPLYSTFDRVGCFPCQAAGDAHKIKAYQFDNFGREQYRIVKLVAEQINKPMFNSKFGKEMDSGCLICSY